jgi:TatD DNase family protein
LDLEVWVFSMISLLTPRLTDEPRSSMKETGPSWIDSHAHLDMPAYEKDRADVIQRALRQGVTGIITIGTDLDSSRTALSIAREYPNIRSTVGVHPHDAASLQSDDLPQLRELAQDPRVVAIGEAGLDYYRNLSPQEDQRSCFRMMIQLARETSLPLVVHDREAHQEILTILKEEKAAEIGGIFHCFSGDWAMAKQCLDLNFFISITGAVTFKKGSLLEEVIRRAPLQSLLLETDCPYLTPHPYRGRRNEPAYLIYTAQEVARIRKVSLEELSKIILENTFQAFRGRLDGAP